MGTPSRPESQGQRVPRWLQGHGALRGLRGLRGLREWHTPGAPEAGGQPSLTAPPPAWCWAVLMALAGALGHGTASATVYRCTAPGTYSDKPCEGGTRLAPHRVPSVEEQAEALRVAAREQALASQLRAERHARERQPVATVPAGIRHGALSARDAGQQKPKLQGQYHRGPRAQAAARQKNPPPAAEARHSPQRSQRGDAP